MAKDSYWFRHDSTSGRGTRMRKMSFIYGHWGKGIYWDVIEILRDQSNYCFPKSEFDLKMLCDLIGCKDESKFINWYHDCVRFELFFEDDTMFYSQVLCENMKRWETSKSNGYKGGKPKRNLDETKHVTQTIPNTKPKRNHKRREEDRRKGITYPTLPEVVSYFIEHGYTQESATKAFNYYGSNDWKDSKGNIVKSWKQKMQGVWFKDENKAQQKKTHNITRDVWFIARQVPAEMERICNLHGLTTEEFQGLYAK